MKKEEVYIRRRVLAGQIAVLRTILERGKRGDIEVVIEKLTKELERLSPIEVRGIIKD